MTAWHSRYIIIFVFIFYARKTMCNKIHTRKTRNIQLRRMKSETRRAIQQVIQHIYVQFLFHTAKF